MPKLRTISIALVSSCLACVLGFVFGFYQGMRAYGVIDSTPRGALAVGNLHAMERGNNQPITLLLESYVDSALGSYSELQEKWWYPLFTSGWLLVDSSKFENYVTRAAMYRSTHPSPLRVKGISEPSDKNETLSDDQKQMFSEIEKFQIQVDIATKKYAK